VGKGRVRKEERTGKGEGGEGRKEGRTEKGGE